MKFLPYTRFEITSPLRREDALKVFAAHVEATKWFRWNWPNSANDTRFEGEMTASGFEVRRILGYRNSFVPVVRGEIESAGAMSRITITMRPLIIVIAFCALWCAAVVSMAATGEAWLSVAMLAFLYVLVMGGFWFEASKQERVLREIFQAM